MRSEEARDAPFLIVEDDVFAARALARHVRRHGEVVLARSAAEAYELLDECRPLSGVFLDWKLPGDDGLAVLERIRGLWPDLPVLVVTAFVDGACINRVQALRAEFASKPVATENLDAFIDFALGRTSAHALRRVTASYAARAGLSRLEHRVLGLTVRDVPRSQLREELGVKETTVKTLVQRLLRKTGAPNLQALAREVRDRAASAPKSLPWARAGGSTMPPDRQGLPPGRDGGPLSTAVHPAIRSSDEPARPRGEPRRSVTESFIAAARAAPIEEEREEILRLVRRLRESRQSPPREHTSPPARAAGVAKCPPPPPPPAPEAEASFREHPVPPPPAPAREERPRAPIAQEASDVRILALLRRLAVRVEQIEDHLKTRGEREEPAAAPSLPSPAERPDYTFGGRLRETLLSDMLQLASSNAMSGVFVVEHDGSKTSLYFKEGQIFHAEGPDSTGEAAFFLAMGIEEGTYYFQETTDLPEEHTISSNTQFLILEALRQVDESRAG